MNVLCPTMIALSSPNGTYGITHCCHVAWGWWVHTKDSLFIWEKRKEKIKCPIVSLNHIWMFVHGHILVVTKFAYSCRINWSDLKEIDFSIGLLDQLD